ncbi:MAG: class I SAM-dependent methyltransferase [Candidatus Ornithospirochaeta sp.]
MTEGMWWNNKKIEWYERASDHCGFHDLLTSCIEKYIERENLILELGCGTGRIAENLCKDGYSVLAIDNDENAIRKAEERSGLSIFRKSDYRDKKYSGDTVLTVFFGRFWVEDNLSLLMSLSRKNLVSVHSLHMGQGIRGKYTPSLTESLEYLRNKRYEAEAEEIEIPFHQPLLSYEEGLDFIKSSYGEDKLSLYRGSIEESPDKEFPFIFRNDKRMVILSAKKN